MCLKIRDLTVVTVKLKQKLHLIFK